MPIRLVDASVNLGRLNPTLSSFTSAFTGTRTLPASRTGTISTGFSPIVASFVGQYQASASRTGTIGSTLSGITSAMTGSFAAPGTGLSPDFGWQLTPSNTGLARLGINGASLPLYTPAAIIPAGTVVTMRRITANLIRCHLGNITFDRCYFQPTAAHGGDGYIYGYNLDIGAGNQAGNLTMIDCDIDGSAIPGSVALWKQCAIRATGTFQRNRIWGFGSGIAIFGSNAVQNGLVELNHVAGLRDGSDSHNEAATIRGFNQTRLDVRKNYFYTDVDQSSGGLFIQCYTSNIRNVWVEDNYLNAPTNIDLYLENGGFGNTYSNMNANNNRLVNGTRFASGAGWATWTNNYRYNAATPPNNQGAVVTAP